jgi:hypothetical protein
MIAIEALQMGREQKNTKCRNISSPSVQDHFHDLLMHKGLGVVNSIVL